MRHERYMELALKLTEEGFAPVGLLTAAREEDMGFLWQGFRQGYIEYALIAVHHDRIEYEFDPTQPGFHLHKEF